MGVDSAPENTPTDAVTPRNRRGDTHDTIAEGSPMYRNFIRTTAMALGTLLVGSSLVLAAGVAGNVTGLDTKGMATVRTSDGKDHQVKVGEGLRLVGLKVECESKNNALNCQPVGMQTAANPTPSTSTPAPAKPAQAPAPSASAPAPSTASPSTSTPSTS